MLHFDSDYMEGAHPAIIERLAATNLDQFDTVRRVNVALIRLKCQKTVALASEAAPVDRCFDHSVAETAGHVFPWRRSPQSPFAKAAVF